MFKVAQQYINDKKLLSPGTTVIVGFSGGPDSLFLLLLLVHLKEHYNLTIIAAHLDHGWRTTSHEDKDFCKNTAEKLGVPFVSAHASHLTLQRKANGSLEETGRYLRRQFFEETAKVYGAQAIALAHHRDDQHETFFIRLLRGAGVTGLSGMWPQQGLYIRPLLTLSKHAIVNYLDAHNYNYLTDPTNQSDLFLRNKIRNSVLPTLANCDSRLSNSLEKTIDNLQEAELFLKELTTIAYSDVTFMHENLLTLQVKDFLNLNLFLQKRVLVEWLCSYHVPFTPSQNFFAEIIRFLEQPESKTHQLHSSWSISKKKNHATITKH